MALLGAWIFNAPGCDKALGNFTSTVTWAGGGGDFCDRRGGKQGHQVVHKSRLSAGNI